MAALPHIPRLRSVDFTTDLMRLDMTWDADGRRMSIVMEHFATRRFHAERSRIIGMDSARGTSEPLAGDAIGIREVDWRSTPSAGRRRACLRLGSPLVFAAAIRKAQTWKVCESRI
jgi:hypothetical protein